MKRIKIQPDEVNYSQYHVIGSINNELIVILIDTGACSSHISPDIVIEMYEAPSEVKYIKYDYEHVTNTMYTEIDIIFSKELTVQMPIMVDNRKIPEKRNVLLGIDFLEQFNYRITNSNLYLNNYEIPRINLFYKDIQEKINNV